MLSEGDSPRMVAASTHHRVPHKDNLLEMHPQVDPRGKKTGVLNQRSREHTRATVSQRLQKYMLSTSCPEFEVWGTPLQNENVESPCWEMLSMSQW